MRNFFKFIFILELFLLPYLFMHLPANTFASSEEAPILDTRDNKYKIRILLVQWEIKAYDEVRVNQELGLNEASEFVIGDWQPFEVKHRMGSFEKNSTIVFNVYSKDVQHGFSINELNLAVASKRPTGEQQGVGDVTNTGDLQWPNEDITISSFCHIFCGLGHPDMKLKFIIGEGSPEIGKFIFWGVIALNIGIFSFVAYSIVKKITV